MWLHRDDLSPGNGCHLAECEVVNVRIDRADLAGTEKYVWAEVQCPRLLRLVYWDGPKPAYFMGNSIMSDPPATPRQSIPSRWETKRRQFLAGLGIAACGSLVGHASNSAELSAADPKAVPKRKRPAPTSGIAGIKELLTRKEPIAWVFTGDDAVHGRNIRWAGEAILNSLPNGYVGN